MKKDDLFGHHDFDEPPSGRDNLFLWTVGILILIGIALASWLGSYYVFGHPEKPESYRLLQKIGKLNPPKRFELTAAPPGEFLTPQKAFERYSAMSRYELAKENEGLLRDYIRNFQSTKRLVPYLTGRYTIMNSYDLTGENFFTSGVVAVAQSVDFPQVLVEHVYTASAKSVPILGKMLAAGLDIKIERLSDLAAVIHVDRLADGRLRFTVVPLLYGAYALKQGSGSFSLEPPPLLNPAGGLPVVRGQLMEDCLKVYADSVRERNARLAGRPGAPAPVPVAVPAAETTIVQVATPTPQPTPSVAAAEEKPPKAVAVAPSSEPGTPDSRDPEPEGPVATAPPVILPETPETSETPDQPVAQVPPQSAPAPVEPAPSPAVAAATPAKPLLQPFLVSAATPAATSGGGGAWKTYNPGQMPRGRLLALSDAADLADRGTGGERLYLRGSFVVTATRDNRAVLRSNSTLGNVIGSASKQARIIVEYPAGSVPPKERESFSRDEMRPFEIRDVQRGSDGLVNIFVREVTNP